MDRERRPRPPLVARLQPADGDRPRPRRIDGRRCASSCASSRSCAGSATSTNEVAAARARPGGCRCSRRRLAGDDRARAGSTPHQRALLDQARRRTSTAARGRDDVRRGRAGRLLVDRVQRRATRRSARNHVLNGLNLGIPEGMITVILGPSGTGKSVLIKHLIGLMFPDQGDVLVHGESVREHAHARAAGDAPQVRDPLPGRRAVRVDERLRQRRVPAAPAHRQVRGRDQGDRRRSGSRRSASSDADNRAAQRALGRHAQARRLRPRARARARDRHVRRARLRPGPGAHRAARAS